ncbi:YtcA family lipoprotein [Acidicapsa acidisoli]|uniref:YtcA family lipoprotein n=1 Tax=Acidicapsa acidisoli TaxID=1615681 RepID=UPI0021E057BF|nr:YtcA family lipoprotein [Acidicapsa acidisoli]
MTATTKKLVVAVSTFAVSLICSGCSRAPSVDILGSFFPVWMICLTTSVILIFGVRYLLVRYKVEQDVGPLALFYPSAVILLTCLMWLILFR